MFKKILLVALIATSLTGCAYLDKRITELQSTVHKYAPLVGKNLLRVGDILVTASCSPLVGTVGDQIHKVLHIVAPNSNAADTVQAFFVTNAAVSAELCPLVTAVKATVGSVPTGTPTQTIATN
jgi:type IV pilus biogenesis protein CpaD/CtpE